MGDKFIVGLDVGTKLGWAKFDAGQHIYSGCLKMKPRAELKPCVMNVINICDGAELVVIEDYAIVFRGAAIALISMGAVIRYELYNNNIPFIDVPPKTLKKFVTGSGNASKKMMVDSVKSRWGMDVEDHNVADAYGLGKIGQVMLTRKTPGELMALRERYGFLKST